MNERMCAKHIVTQTEKIDRKLLFFSRFLAGRRIKGVLTRSYKIMEILWSVSYCKICRILTQVTQILIPVLYIYIHILIKYRVEIIGVNINTTDVRKSTAFTDEKQMPDGQYVRRSTNI